VADNALSDLFDITIRGADGYSQNDYWERAVEINQISNVNLVGLVISGPGGVAYSTKGIGVVVEGSTNNPAVVFNVTGATFDYLSKGIVYGQQVQGLTVSQSNFVGDDYGIYVPPDISGLDQLAVTGSQFNCQTAGIYVGSSLSNTLFSTNLFIVPNTGTGIHLQQAYLYSATGNSFNIGSRLKGNTHPIGIEVGSTAGGGTITGNLFDNMRTAIVLDRASTGANVQSNEYSNDSTMVKNLGTGNTVGGGTP
jgi:nitrous oxidase accessory protein NosD